MKTIEVDELKERIDEILRVVQEQGETFEIIDHGKTIARIVPADEAQTSTKRDLPRSGYAPRALLVQA